MLIAYKEEAPLGSASYKDLKSDYYFFFFLAPPPFARSTLYGSLALPT